MMRSQTRQVEGKSASKLSKSALATITIGALNAQSLTSGPSAVEQMRPMLDASQRARIARVNFVISSSERLLEPTHANFATVSRKDLTDNVDKFIEGLEVKHQEQELAELVNQVLKEKMVDAFDMPNMKDVRLSVIRGLFDDAWLVDDFLCSWDPRERASAVVRTYQGCACKLEGGDLKVVPAPLNFRPSGSPVPTNGFQLGKIISLDLYKEAKERFLRLQEIFTKYQPSV